MRLGAQTSYTAAGFSDGGTGTLGLSLEVLELYLCLILLIKAAPGPPDSSRGEMLNVVT